MLEGKNLKVVVSFESNDLGSNLTIQESDLPQPAENEVLVRVLLRPVNPSDIGMVYGRGKVCDLGRTYGNKCKLRLLVSLQSCTCYIAVFHFVCGVIARMLIMLRRQY